MRRFFATFLTFASCCLFSADALAAGTPSKAAGSGEASLVVFAVLAVGAAYLLAHFVVNRLQRKLLVVAGLEYVLIGLLLGPAIPGFGVLGSTNLTSILPLVALAAGWVGLLKGVALDFSEFKLLPMGAIRVVFTHILFSFTGPALAAYYLFTSGWLGEVSDGRAVLCAGVLGCCAATSSSTPLSIVDERYVVKGTVAPLLRGGAKLNSIIVIALFGILLCVFHPKRPGVPLQLTATEWSVVLVALGTVLGVLFTLFLIGDETENGRFLAMVGIIAFASGAAYFLEISALAVNLVLGISLANFAREVEEDVRQTLRSTEQPMRLVLLVIAGLLIRVPDFSETLGYFGLTQPVQGSGFWAHAAWIVVQAGCYVALLLVFLGVRYVSKIIASQTAVFGTNLRRDLYRGLIHSGEVAIAMAISFQVLFDGNIVNLVYAIVIGSVILQDLLAPRVMRSLLFDAGELTRERKGEEPIGVS